MLLRFGGGLLSVEDGVGTAQRVRRTTGSALKEGLETGASGDNDDGSSTSTFSFLLLRLARPDDAAGGSIISFFCSSSLLTSSATASTGCSFLLFTDFVFTLDLDAEAFLRCWLPPAEPAADFVDAGKVEASLSSSSSPSFFLFSSLLFRPSSSVLGAVSEGVIFCLLTPAPRRELHDEE